MATPGLLSLPKELLNLISSLLEPPQRLPLKFIKCFHRLPSVASREKSKASELHAFIISAIILDSIAQLKWISAFLETPMDRYCPEAALWGRLEILIWLNSIYGPCSERTAVVAANHAQLHVLSWYLESGFRINRPLFAELYDIAGKHFQGERYSVAEQIYRLIQKHIVSVVSATDNLILDSLRETAQCLLLQARLAEAQLIYAELLPKRIAALGSDHAETINTVEWLAKCHLDLSQFEEAIKLYTQACEARACTAGEDSLDTLRARSNLGFILYNRGRYAEAEQMHRQVLERRTAVIGPQSTKVAVSRAHLSICLRAQNKSAEADEILCQLQEDYPPSLPEHPDLSLCWETLAKSLVQHQQYAAAELLYRRVLLSHITTLSSNHNHTVAARESLAETLYKQKKDLDEANMLMQSVHEMRLKRFGADHPLTISALQILTSQGQLSNATSAVQSYYN